jgi:cytochrome c biogenesis protein CcdA
MRVKMVRLNKAYVFFSFILFLLLVEVAYSTKQVSVEFLYWDPRTDLHYCDACPPWEVDYDKFLEKNDTMNRIQSDYAGLVLVEWKEYYNGSYLDGKYITTVWRDGELSPDAKLYNFNQSNSLVIMDGEGHFRAIEGDFNETYIREVIDAYIEGTSPPPPPPPLPLIAVLPSAFVFGFLETFSPCLIALLSFVLSYTIEKTTQFKEGLLQVMTFAAGFVFAAILLGLLVGLTFISFAPFYNIIVWIVCILAISFGLNLLGFNFLRFLKVDFNTKPLVKSLTRRHAFTFSGLVLLGFLFYFLDPCLAPVFVSSLLVFSGASSSYLPQVLFVFGLGAITPFIGIGIFAGSISKLARSSYRHKSKIRAVSGLILIAYAIYLIAKMVIGI